MCGDIYEFHFRIVMATYFMKRKGLDRVRFTDLDVTCDTRMNLA